MRFCPLSRFHSGWRSQPLRMSRVLFGAGNCLPARFFAMADPCAWPGGIVFSIKRRGLHAVLPALQRFFG